jgi:hypothetical protein
MKAVRQDRFKARVMKEFQTHNREQPLKSILKVKPQEQYYAQFTPPLKGLDSYSAVVRDEKVSCIKKHIYINMCFFILCENLFYL